MEKVINAFLQYLEMDPEKNEVNYDTYGRFHACYESVADAVYGEKQDANARRNDTKWLDTLWKQNRRKIRTIVLRMALEQSRITREQLEKCRRKALERASSNYDFLDASGQQVDSKNRNRPARRRDSRNACETVASGAQNGALQTQAGPSNEAKPNYCVPVPVDRCVKLAIFTSNSLKLGQLLAPFEMPNGTLLVLDNDEVFVFQKAHVNLNLQMALPNGQSQSAAATSQSSVPISPAPTRTRNKRKSNAPRSSSRSKRFYEPADDSGVALESEPAEAEPVVEFNEPDTRSSSNYSNVTGSPIVSNEDDLTAVSVRARSRVSKKASCGWLDGADVKPLIIAE